MRWLFIIRLAIANLMAKKLRTGLTVGGIALSVGVMVFLLGLGNGDCIKCAKNCDYQCYSAKNY